MAKRDVSLCKGLLPLRNCPLREFFVVRVFYRSKQQGAVRHVPGFKPLPPKRGRRKHELKILKKDWEVYREISSRGANMSALAAADKLSRRKPNLGSKGSIDSRYRKVVGLLDGNDLPYAQALSLIAEREIARKLSDTLKAGMIPELTDKVAQELLQIVNTPGELTKIALAAPLKKLK